MNFYITTKLLAKLSKEWLPIKSATPLPYDNAIIMWVSFIYINVDMTKMIQIEILELNVWNL